MAIQQKAPAQQENLSSEDALTYKLTLHTAKKNRTPQPPQQYTPVSPKLTTDLLKTGAVFIVIVGILLFLYLRLQ